jgi:hypothetical protein
MLRMGPGEILRRTVLVSCAALSLVSRAGFAGAQDAEPVAPFGLVSLLLTALVSEKMCKGLEIDHDAFDRFLADKGIAAFQLSREGPHAADVLRFRHRLRREFRRRNAEACASSLARFGPEGADIPGLLRRS